MADLISKRETSLSLEAMTAPAVEKTIAKPSQEVEPAMPQINRPQRADSAPSLSPAQAEKLAFQRLSNSSAQQPSPNTQTTVRSLNQKQSVSLDKIRPSASPRNTVKTKSSKKLKSGFVGETILDKLVNSVLHIMRAALRFLSRKLIGNVPIKRTVTLPTEAPKPEPKVKVEKKKYYPQRPM